jgi:hypothetical protein
MFSALLTYFYTGDSLWAWALCLNPAYITTLAATSSPSFSQVTMDGAKLETAIRENLKRLGL